MLKRAAELGYTANPFARVLSGKATKIVGALVSRISSPFYAEILNLVAARLSKQDMTLMLNEVPPLLDEMIRRRAAETGKSPEQLVIEAIWKQFGIDPNAPVHHDLDFAIGSWVEDPEFDKYMAEQDRIDPEMWK